jgi:His/Glu/Gln/Arg/opine family amino acid ABC transporter permease subunit
VASSYDWDFSVLLPFAGAYARATLVTIELSVASFVCGTIGGAALGAMLRVLPGVRLWLVLNDSVRAVPPLVLLFLVYFFPTRELLGVMPPSPFWASVIAFSIAQAAYTADLVRVAVDQVPRSITLAGLAIGLERVDLWRFVIIPDVIRQVTPAQIAFFIGILRLSNLASVIGTQDVVYVSRVISAQTFRSLEPWLLVALIYIGLVLPLTMLLREFERSAWFKRRG